MLPVEEKILTVTWNLNVCSVAEPSLPPAEDAAPDNSSPSTSTTRSPRAPALATLAHARAPGAGAPTSSPARALSIARPVRNEILAERTRVGWTDASDITDKVKHKLQSLVRLRSQNDKAKAFVSFMVESIGTPGTSVLNLGEGWTRVTRRIANRTTSLDFLTDRRGAIVNVKQSGRLPVLPPGKEQAAYSNVLKELQTTGNSILREVPVHYVNWNTDGYVLPTHGFVAAGDPGKGRRSGAVLYAVGGDPKRGPVTLDNRLMKRLNAKGAGTYKLPEQVRETIARLTGEHFISREDFYRAYSRARGESSDAATIQQEMSSIYRLLPRRTMELWPRTTADYRASRPCAAERDLRVFENPPADIRRGVVLKQISGVKSIDLLETKRQFVLHQLYQDERLGRNGTGIPSEDLSPVADIESRRALTAATPTFQRLPHTTDTVGNCNSGAASLLQRAMDKYDGRDAGRYRRATAASMFAIGSHHRIALWDPLASGKDARDREGDASFAAATSSGQLAVGTLTEAIHTDLVKTGASRYCHVDGNAFVLSTVPSSEDYQKKLIRMTIESAERFAILTSFSINPTMDHEPGNVSRTTFSILESLAGKQHDKNFTFVLLYNDNKLQRNAVVSALVGQNVTANMSLKSKSQTRGTITWPDVISAYNRQQSDENLRITDLQCGVYFVAAKAKGVAGSHHNKFCINDTGVAATLGASVANKTKDNWIDGGCITVSAPLAARQRDYFLDVLIGEHDVHCARLRVDRGTPVMASLGDTGPIQALAGIEVRSPLDTERIQRGSAMEHFRRMLDRVRVPFEGARHKILWIQNPSNGYRNMFSARSGVDEKPIGRAMSTIFQSATAGDTIDIANKKIGCEGFSLITGALSKGCNVNILVDRSARRWVEYAAKRFYANCRVESPGRLTIKHFAPSESLAQRLNINTRQEPVLHAKNYVLTRANGSCVVMTGSYNLDGQSHYRSNENLMIFETLDASLRKSLFDELYQENESPTSVYPV